MCAMCMCVYMNVLCAVCVCIHKCHVCHVYVHKCHGARVGVRGWFSGIGSLLSPCGSLVNQTQVTEVVRRSLYRQSHLIGS